MRKRVHKPPVGARAVLLDLKKRVRRHATVQKLRFGRPSPFPTLIDFEVTNHCNLDCIMCPRDVMTRPKGLMDFEFFKEIIDQIPPHTIEKSWFHLYGEPLMHPQLPEMIQYARAKTKIRELGVSTNCVLLDKEKSRALLETPLDTIVLSIDGATRETYEKIRRNADFDTVLENAARFIEMRQEKGLTRPAAWLQIVEMQENATEIERFREYWEPLLGAADQIFVKNYTTFGGQVADRANYYRRMPRTRLPCSFLWDYFVIYWDGRVTPCCFDVNGDLCIGDLRKSTIKEIWSSPELAEFRRIHLRGAYSEMPLCEKCWGH
jgi:radical SAM protein with 4Fe4S-binding SPASM domain